MAKNTTPLERVRLLLDRAEHPNTPEAERELCFMQANKLMAKHAIDEVLLNASRTQAEREAPTRKVVTLGDGARGEFWPILRTILGGCAQANRCRAVTDWSGRSCEIFGFAEDVEWTEMFFTSIYFTFISTINPKWDESKDWDENVYNFKVAGYKWSEINEMSVAHGGPDCRKYEERYSWTDREYKMMPTDKLTGKLIAGYKRHAKKIGDTNMVRTQSHEAYRRQYAEAFQSQMLTRLWRMEDESKEQYKSSGAELAIIDRQEDVNRLLFETHPHLSPEAMKLKAQQAEEARERQERELQERLDAMTPEQREEYYSKKARQQERDAARDKKYWEQERRRHDRSAHRRGRAAADSVVLSRSGKVDGAGRAGSIES